MSTPLELPHEHPAEGIGRASLAFDPRAQLPARRSRQTAGNEKVRARAITPRLVSTAHAECRGDWKVASSRCWCSSQARHDSWAWKQAALNVRGRDDERTFILPRVGVGFTAQRDLSGPFVLCASGSYRWRPKCSTVTLKNSHDARTDERIFGEHWSARDRKDRTNRNERDNRYGIVGASPRHGIVPGLVHRNFGDERRRRARCASQGRAAQRQMVRGPRPGRRGLASTIVSASHSRGRPVNGQERKGCRNRWRR